MLRSHLHQFAFGPQPVLLCLTVLPAALGPILLSKLRDLFVGWGSCDHLFGNRLLRRGFLRCACCRPRLCGCLRLLRFLDYLCHPCLSFAGLGPHRSRHPLQNTGFPRIKRPFKRLEGISPHTIGALIGHFWMSEGLSPRESPPAFRSRSPTGFAAVARSPRQQWPRS